MIKRIVCTGIVLVMVLSLFFAACSNSSEKILTQYKAEAKTEIEEYADAKGESNYIAWRWSWIKETVALGKTLIDEATDKNGIDFVVGDVKNAINSAQIKLEFAAGFYSLDEAYGSGWLTQEDLRSISWYYNGRIGDPSALQPKDPEFLCQETENKIKQAYLDALHKLEHLREECEAALDDISISHYYGTYADCITVGVWCNLADYLVQIVTHYSIGGVGFGIYTERKILVWIS